MNDEPNSIWRKPWRGPVKVLAWFALLAGAVFLTVFGMSLALGQNYRLSDLIASSLAITVCLAVLGVLVMLVIRWLCRWRNLKRFLFVVACLVTLFALFHVEENWRGHRAWKKLQEEAAAKGERLDLASIIPPAVPDAENMAMAPIFEGLRKEFDTEWRRAHSGPTGLTNELDRLKLNLWRTNGSSSDVWPGNWIKGERTDLNAWQHYYRTSRVDSGANEFPVAPQTQSPAADVLLALSKFDPVVEELREASRRPRSRFPINYEDGFQVLLPHLAKIKACCQFLALRATAELAAGQSDRALADVKLSFRMMDCIHDEPLLISQLVRLSASQITLQPIWEGLADHKWNDAELAELQTELARLDFLADYQLGMRGERAFSFWTVDYVRRMRDMSFMDLGEGSPEQRTERTFGKLLFRLAPGGWFDQNKVVLGRMNLEFVQSAIDLQTRVVSPAAARRLQAACENALKNWSPKIVFARMLIPALGNAAQRTARSQASVDQAHVACALERYRLAQGEYPDKLDALVPRFIAKLPHDVVNGQPLKYRRTDDGQFVLYSVGWNETDDGGINVFTKNKKTIDWKQGDWVWRYPAK